MNTMKKNIKNKLRISRKLPPQTEAYLRGAKLNPEYNKLFDKRPKKIQIK